MFFSSRPRLPLRRACGLPSRIYAKRAGPKTMKSIFFKAESFY
jgi:hypothetical protein